MKKLDQQYKERLRNAGKKTKLNHGWFFSIHFKPSKVCFGLQEPQHVCVRNPAARSPDELKSSCGNPCFVVRHLGLSVILPKVVSAVKHGDEIIS